MIKREMKMSDKASIYTDSPEDLTKLVIFVVVGVAGFLVLIVGFCIFKRNRVPRARGDNISSRASRQPQQNTRHGSTDVRIPMTSVDPDRDSECHLYANVEVTRGDKRRQYISMHMRTAEYSDRAKSVRESARSKYKSRSCVVSSQTSDSQDSEPIYLNTSFKPEIVKKKMKKKEKKEVQYEEVGNPYVN